MYIFDIDGTLADCEHRMHYIKTKPKNFNAFYASVRYDTPMWEMCRLVQVLSLQDEKLVFCTGRPEKTRRDTERWLLDYAYLPKNGRDFPLYMRADNDYRQDTIVKSELLDKIIADGFDPKIVFDDRPRVCDMWKQRGLLVCRVGDREHF